MGACRANEMYLMKLGDIQDLGSAFLITIPNTKTKITRKFTVTDHFYEICKRYINLRPPGWATSNANVFFLNFQNGKCTSQRIGINKFTQMGKDIAKFLKLPNPGKYSGHSFRRSAATILVDAGGDITALKRHGGWKSTAVAEGYVDESMKNKMDTASKISKSIESSRYQQQIASTSTSTNHQHIAYTSNHQQIASASTSTTNQNINVDSSNSIPNITLHNCVNANITINISK